MLQHKALERKGNSMALLFKGNQGGVKRKSREGKSLLWETIATLGEDFLYSPRPKPLIKETIKTRVVN